MEIQLSSAAVARMQQIAAHEGKAAIRLAVKAAGCSGLEYVMEPVDAPFEGDLVQAYDGFALCVDADSYAEALKGLHLDFQSDLLSSAFVYNNPNQKGACGCGKSFSV